MAVTDGQPVNGNTVNKAFVSKLADSVMKGILTLENSNSATVTNVQQVINQILERISVIIQGEEGSEILGLKKLSVDNIEIDGNVIKQEGGSNIHISPSWGQWVFLNGHVFVTGRQASEIKTMPLSGEDVSVVTESKAIRLTNPDLESIHQILWDAHGQEVLFLNKTGRTVIFKHDAAEALGFRIITPDEKDIKLPHNASCGFIYDNEGFYWTPVGGIGSGGSPDVGIKEVSENYAALEEDDILLVDTTGGDIEITLPLNYTKKMTIKKLVDDNAVIIKGGTIDDGESEPVQETVDGGTEYQLFNTGNSVTLIKHNSGWFTI